MRTAAVALSAALVAVFLTLFACSPASRPEPEGGGVRAAPGKPQWEYRIVVAPPLERNEPFEDRMGRFEGAINKMAAEGWEYVESMSLGSAFLFRRLK